MKMSRASLLPVGVAAAGTLFCAQAGYALLSLDQHYRRVQQQTQQWCEKAAGCANARLTGDLSAPEITVELRPNVRNRTAAAERVRNELQTKGILVVADEQNATARAVALRVQ